MPCDSWVDPILRLLGDEPEVMNTLTQKGWAAINNIKDVIFDAIINICPKDSSFIISQELLQNNPWHKNFYEQVEHLAKARNAQLIPVRLICDTPVLLERVISEDRKKFYKTRSPNMIKERAMTTEPFKSTNKNELTLDTTDLSIQQTAKKILQHLEDLGF